MARIGIFGGTFNPIHNGHLKIARAALEQYQLDRILFMPAGTPPHKSIDDQVSAEQRLAMVRAAVDQENRLMEDDKYAVSSYEILQEGKSYTYKTLTYLCDKFPENRYYFLIGEDSLRSFSTWRYPEKICKKAQLLVAVRQQWDSCDMQAFAKELEAAKQKFGDCFHLLRTENFPVSSTEIRRRLYRDPKISDWVPEDVYHYILEHRLYKNEGQSL